MRVQHDPASDPSSDDAENAGGAAPTLDGVTRGLPAGRRLLVAAAIAAAALLHGASAGAAPAEEWWEQGQRPQLIDIPVGCHYEPFNNSLIVFVGTVVDDDYRTVRYRVDQVRAGDMNLFGSQVGNETLVDVRYTIDTKYLTLGGQYLVGARYNANQTVLVSKVAPRPAAIGDDEIIGSQESLIECPPIDDPVMTMRTDGTPIPSGMFKPLVDDRARLFAVVALPAAIVLGTVFLLALIKWTVTSLGASSEAARERRKQRRGYAR